MVKVCVLIVTLIVCKTFLGHNSLDQIFHLMEQCPFESAVDTRALSEIFTSIDLFTAIQCLSKLYRITREQTAMDAMVSAITLINEPQQLMLAAKLTKQPEVR
jgi:hypothetical protein